MTTTQLDNFKTFLNTLSCENVDIAYFATEDTDTFEALRDAIYDGNGFDVEIIHYTNAIEYLKENDPSLRDSVEIANDMGYTTDSINSELLASLLASRNARIDFDELEDDITDFLEELLAEDVEDDTE
jgi:hypothetical protein